MLKGTFHQVSVKHLHRYLSESMWRHNHSDSPVLDQMGSVVRNMDGRRLRLREMRAGGRSLRFGMLEQGQDQRLPLQGGVALAGGLKAGLRTHINRVFGTAFGAVRLLTAFWWFSG